MAAKKSAAKDEGNLQRRINVCGGLYSCDAAAAWSSWDMIVEYCYVGTVHTPCDDILTYANDRRARRKMTEEERRKVAKNAKQY